MGWFLVAMVDVLERMDEQMYYEYRAIMAMFKEAVEAMIAVPGRRDRHVLAGH